MNAKTPEHNDAPTPEEEEAFAELEARQAKPVTESTLSDSLRRIARVLKADGYNGCPEQLEQAAEQIEQLQIQLADQIIRYDAQCEINGDLHKHLAAKDEELDEIRGIAGVPSATDLARHNLSDSLVNRIKYNYREWLDQTHAIGQRLIAEQAKSDKLNAELERARSATWGEAIKMLEHLYMPVARDDQAKMLSDILGEFRDKAYHSALASPAAEPTQQTVYVEAYECSECHHSGINDSAPDISACGYPCGWSGPRPNEDTCPDCGRSNLMSAACPKCNSMYRLVASGDIKINPATATEATMSVFRALWIKATNGDYAANADKEITGRFVSQGWLDRFEAALSQPAPAKPDFIVLGWRVEELIDELCPKYTYGNRPHPNDEGKPNYNQIESTDFTELAKRLFVLFQPAPVAQSEPSHSDTICDSECTWREHFPRCIATKWREQNGYVGKGGVVTVFDDQVCGWTNELRNPENWTPGAIAVDEHGNQWEARGGDEQRGALRWEPVAQSQEGGRP